MPFDSAPQAEVIAPPIEEDLSFARGPEGLRRLAILLRREMPERFHWDYGEFLRAGNHNCRTRGCALGLAYLEWPQFEEMVESAKRVNMVSGYHEAAAEAFRISMMTSQALFAEVGLGKPPYTRANTTPAMVADAIDQYLARVSLLP